MTRRALTLVEVLAAIALLSMLAAAVVPLVSPGTRKASRSTHIARP